MRLLLTAAVALLLASPADAQLVAPNSAGVTFAHVHLNVADLELNKRLWVEQFGGEIVQKGPLVTIKYPNFLLVFTEREPTGDSRGIAACSRWSSHLMGGDADGGLRGPIVVDDPTGRS